MADKRTVAEIMQERRAKRAVKADALDRAKTIIAERQARDLRNIEKRKQAGIGRRKITMRHQEVLARSKGQIRRDAATKSLAKSKIRKRKSKNMQDKKYRLTNRIKTLSAVPPNKRSSPQRREVAAIRRTGKWPKGVPIILGAAIGIGHHLKKLREE